MTPSTTPGAVPYQQSPRLALEEGMAGLDVFSDAAPPRPRDTTRLPAVAEASQPIPLALGHITSSQPAVAVSDPLSGLQSGPGSGPWSGAREPTPTAQLRAATSQDVARRAIHELGVLGRELDALPERLEESGLVGIHQRSYRDAALAYLGLAEHAWEAVARERLEQTGAEAEYRERALDVARRIAHMQEESASVLQNTDFRLSSRRPLFWHHRARLVRAGLEAWMATLATPADPLTMGQGLFQLRGFIGLANAGALSLLLFGALMVGINTLCVALALGLALLQIPTILSRNAALDGALVGYLVIVAAVWLLALALAVAGRAPLRLQLGATLWSPMRSVRDAQRGSPLVAGLLRGWSGLWMLLGVLGGIVALVESIMWLRSRWPVALPTTLPAGLQLAGGSLIALAAPAAGVLVATLLLVALPLLLLDQARFTAELGGNPSWVPAARRSVLRPTVGILGFLTGGLVIAVHLVASAAGLAESSRALLILLAPTFEAMITWRAVLVALALVAPYLLLVELPFRAGVKRYQRRWLQDLATRRATLESHMRRLSVRDPLSGQQDASDDNLRAMQYDLILLQFYRSKIEEAQRIRIAPFGLARVLAFVVLAVLFALALENAGALFALLLDNRDALLHLLP